MGYLQELKATLEARRRDERIIKGVLEHLVVVMRSAFVSRQADERWWRKDDAGAFRAAGHFDDAVTFDSTGKACVALDFRMDDLEHERRAVRIGIERKGDGFSVTVEMKDPIQVPVNPMPEDCNKFAALVFEAAKARL
jgi:hypothetical protein